MLEKMVEQLWNIWGFTASARPVAILNNILEYEARTIIDVSHALDACEEKLNLFANGPVSSAATLLQDNMGTQSQSNDSWHAIKTRCEALELEFPEFNKDRQGECILCVHVLYVELKVKIV